MPETVEPDKFRAEILILDLVSKQTNGYRYIVSHKKELLEATIPPILLKNFGRNSLQFGTVLNGFCSVDLNSRQLRVLTVKVIYLLDKAKNNKWAELKLEFSSNLKKFVIGCPALTTGCFTHQNREFKSGAVYNDVLGIIVDPEDSQRLPSRKIGRLFCTVTTEHSENGWQWRLETMDKFESVFSLAQSVEISQAEHFGLITREECETKRDLRLVSCRDFPRDVRIFRSGNHCCEGFDVGHRRLHQHSECQDTCVGDVNLIGRCVAFEAKRCQGMCNSEDTSSQGQHVDSRTMRTDVTQLEVNVHGGFVEVETIAEFSGHTDHNGYPLLWSHDVEFVVDIVGIFHEQNKGLYTVKVVRFYRHNVFAKWRLARRNPIIKAIQTRFHSQSAHSINLATIDVRTGGLSADELDGVFGEEEEPERRRLPSFSRFGNTTQSLCLPRTDSLDNMELFEAMLRNERSSFSFGALSRGGFAASVHSEQNIDEDDDSLWTHHNSSVLRIVDDDNASSNNVF